MKGYWADMPTRLSNGASRMGVGIVGVSGGAQD